MSMNAETFNALLPHITSRQITSLAFQSGLTPHQVKAHAKKLGCEMQPKDSVREFSTGEDRIVLRHDDDTAARRIGCGRGPVAARRRALAARRAARAGTWTDDELFSALYGSPPVGRSHHETMTRRLQAGITSASTDEEITLADAAKGLGVNVHDLIVAVLRRHLAVTSPMPDDEVPTSNTRTSMRRIGAWVVAFPAVLERGVDGAFLVRALLLCGASIGKQM